ncbi:hypothetical protein O1L60_28620 [Streptomyces diastatochromogenes]|nr:hypothetical protein [Streptomyces diastatochromogenes]
MRGSEGEASAGRRFVGVLLGCLSSLLLLVSGAVLGPFLLWPRARPALMAWARRLADLERGRRSVFFGDRFPARTRSPNGGSCAISRPVWGPVW